MAQDHDELNVSRWSASTGIDHRQLPDELLVYVNTTADTHLLEIEASAVLITLIESPHALTAAELDGEIFDDALADAAGRSGMTLSILEQLEQIGLATRAAP